MHMHLLKMMYITLSQLYAWMQPRVTVMELALAILVFVNALVVSLVIVVTQPHVLVHQSAVEKEPVPREVWYATVMMVHFEVTVQQVCIEKSYHLLNSCKEFVHVVTGAIHKRCRNTLGGEGVSNSDLERYQRVEVRVIRVKIPTWGRGVSEMAKKIPTSFMDLSTKSCISL